MHACGHKFCRICKKKREVRHNCFIPPIAERVSKDEDDEDDEKKNNELIFVFFDFETIQDVPLPGQSNKFEHTVNLALAQQVCLLCENNEDIAEDCENCGKRQHIFLGNKSLDMFMIWPKP